MTAIQHIRLPFRSVAAALLFALTLGPVGLLYSTTLGGIVMIAVGFVVVPTWLPVPIIMVWLGSAIWGVIATNRYNKKLLQKINIV